MFKFIQSCALKSAIVTMLFVILSQNAKAQSFSFPEHEMSVKVTANDIKTLGTLPTIDVYGSSWGATIGPNLKIKSAHNFVKFYIDHNYPTKIPTPYRYGIGFWVSGNTFSGSATITYPPDTLALSYNPDSLAVYQDQVFSKYSGLQHMTIHVTGLFDLNASPIASVPLSTFTNLNFIIEGTILTQAYDKRYSSQTYYGTAGAPSTNLKATGSLVTTSDYAQINWNLNGVSATSPVPIEPVNFELEWLYVDNYKKNINTGAVSEIAASALKYDFNKNATRVWLDKNNFRIPVIYQKGYIVYRVRMVRPDSNNYEFPIYGQWNLPDNGFISSISSSAHYLKINNAHKNDSLNWQYTVSFAENGKYKHVLSYFDGLLKNRQSITRFNGTPNKLIATEQVYDYEGRPAISILPTPIESDAFTYQSKLSLNALTGLPYKAGDFDTLLKTICPGEVPPAKLHADALANIYYSPSNPDKAGMQKFVPDAGGYPFVQTIYSAGYDKRIDRQGGAGDSLQIGFGHDTYNDYVSADQRDLNSLFGIDIGWSGYYRKTVTTDPNGQVSMSVQDFRGKQVASAMIGRGPDVVKHAIIPNDNVPDSSFKIDELIEGNPQSIVGHKKILNRDFYMDAQGNDSIQYVFDFVPMYVCPNKYLCVKAHYNYEIFDQCGVSKLYVENSIGKTGVVATGAVVSDAEPRRGVYLNKGKHSLRKELTINEEDAYAAVDSLMKEPPPCFKDEPYFIKQSVLKEKFPCPKPPNPCELLKKQMMDELWPKKKYGQYSIVDSVLGTDNSIFTQYCGLPLPPPSMVGGGSGPSAPVTPTRCLYRYQRCEEIVFPTTVYKFGRAYTDIATLPVDTFIYIFNDEIAEALLPLHPEYCKLLSCYDDDYKEKLESFPSAQTAEDYHRFALDSIIKYDPILPKLSSGPLYFTNARDSLATYRGGNVGIDTMALMKAYCNCTDSLMAMECFTNIFKTPINTITFADAKVKENYYKALLGSYFANRERYKSYIVAAAEASSCDPCATLRMTLIPEAVVKSFFLPDGKYDESSFGSGMTDILKRLISFGSGTMTADTLYAYRDSAALRFDSANIAITKAKIDSTIANFANCTPSANLSAVSDTLHALALRLPILYGNFTPDHIRYALTINGIALTDLCNPYMIEYNYHEAISMPDNISCKSVTYYTAVKDFFNKASIDLLVEATASGTSSFPDITLDTYNPFEWDISTVLGSSFIKAYATRNADTTLYTLHLMKKMYGSAIPPDTLRFFFEINKKSLSRPICKNILAHSATPTVDDFEFINIQCIAEDPSRNLGAGYIVDLSFVADIKKTVGTTSVENCQLLSWNNKLKMTQAAIGLEECVPCTQMLSIYKQFSDTMNLYGVKGTDHPLHPTLLVNFFNSRLNRTFDWEQYTRFIESCALADSLPIARYNGYASISFTTDADANTFINNLNTSQAVYMDYFLRYKDDSVRLLLDFRSIPNNKLLAVRNYIAAYATSAKVNNAFNPTAAANFMGWIISYKGTAFDSVGLRSTVSAMFDVDPGKEIDVWTGRRYVKYNRYPVYAKAGVNNTIIAAGIAATANFIETNHLAAYFINHRETTSDDEYPTTEKQAYLSRVYSFYDKKPYEVLDNIKASALEATIFPSRNPQYGSTSAIPDINNLYLAQVAHPGLLKADYMLTKAKNYFKAITPFKYAIATQTSGFPVERKIEIVNTTTEQLNLYLCGDGSYWYRYFGIGDTMCNIFFRMPKYIPDEDIVKYELDNIVATSGKGNSRVLRIKLTKGTDVVYVDGFTDFTVGQSQILHDVLLTNAFGVERPVADTILNCERSKLNSAVRAGKNDYRLYLDSMRLALRKTFYDYVINHLNEKLYLGYIDQRFNYTLYYYDRAGNLIRTIPPAGVNKLPATSLDLVNEKRRDNLITPLVLPDHAKESVYEYNTLDKIVRQKTPDGNEVGYIYDPLGRVIYSQNKKQAAKEAYTYTFYDAQGRVTETGEVDLRCGTMVYLYREGFGTIDSFWQSCIYMWSPGTGGKYGIPPHYSTRNPYIHNANAYTEAERQTYLRKQKRSDVVATIYDTVAQNIGLLEGVNPQENLRKRVACIKFFEVLPPTDTFYRNYTYATHYSYDIAGNVKTLLHDYPTLQIQKQRYKTVDYDYDLASGKVNMLSYNRGWGDQYYQRYTYDDDNRITKVETSADGYMWKRDAEYNYYQHGPLARASIGDLRVQGIDFAYTIQGWLKAVNGDILNPAFEMGKDSMLNNVHAYDAAATAIDYFKGDYKPIGGTAVTHASPATLGSGAGRSLYNGNISSIATDLIPFMPIRANFTYDQLNRIKYAAYDSMSPIIAGLSTLHPTPNYYSNYSYDPDGNITKLIRRANKPGAAMIMDSMTYFYKPVGSPNQLVNITDSADNNYIDDVDKYLEPHESRYKYDAIGNVTMDAVSNQDTITWNLYNKVTQTENHTAKDKMRFVYDGAGHRVAKYYYQYNTDNTLGKERNEYFVHDAQGNILAVYEHERKYDYESLKPTHTVLYELSGAMRTKIGTAAYINEFIAPSLVSKPEFDAAIQPFIARYGNSLPPKPVSLYLMLDRSLTELLIHNSANWVDSIRQFGIEYGNPIVVAAPYATAFVDQNHELAKHIMHTFMSTPDTLHRRQIIEALPTIVSNSGISILYNAHSILDLSIDSTMGAAALASYLVEKTQDNPDALAEALSSSMIAARDSSDYIPYFDYITNPASFTATDPYLAKTVPFLSQTTMGKYGERGFMGMFFEAWSPSYQRLVNLVGLQSLYNTEYYANPAGYLTAMAASLGDAVLDSTIAAMPSMGIDALYEEAHGSVSAASLTLLEETLPTRQELAKEQVLTSENFNLAEHHLYGSSRLGIKNYLSQQVFGYWTLRENIAGTIKITRDSGSLLKRQSWYSGLLNESIKKTAKLPHANIDNNARYQLTHTLGQKQYEVTNHLGNVLSTISDNRYDKMLGTGSGPTLDTIKVFAPAITASYDYYPFGMLMPGRYLAADTITQLVDIFRARDVSVSTLSFMAMPTGASPLGGGSLTTLPGDALQVQADTIGDGMERPIAVMANQYTELQLEASMLLGDPMRASVYELVHDSNQVLRPREIASSIMSVEGTYVMDFTPTTSTVYLRLAYHATGQDGTTAASAGAGGAGSSPAGKGFSKIIVTGHIGTEEKINRWRLVKLVKNPNDYYRFGFNGQEKDNEIYGRGTHYHAQFWGYDARVGKRWNLDPKPQISISDYATFANNPIWNSDRLGDEVKATPEAAAVIKGGVQGVLGDKKSPIDYDPSSNKLTYDENVDVSGLDKEQTEVVSRYKTLIQSKKDFVNVEMIDKDAPLPASIGGTLNKRGSNGITDVGYRISPIESMKSAGVSQVVGTESNVFIARDPSNTKSVTTLSNDVRVASGREVSNERLPKSFSKFVSIHEVIGHAYEAAQRNFYYKNTDMNNLISDEENMRVEDFDKNIRNVFKLDDGSTIKDKTTPHNRNFMKN